MDGFRLDEVRGFEVVGACGRDHLALFEEVGGVNTMLFQEGLELAGGHLVESIVRSSFCCRHLLLSFGQLSLCLFFLCSLPGVVSSGRGEVVISWGTRGRRPHTNTTNKEKKKKKTKR